MKHLMHSASQFCEKYNIGSPFDLDNNVAYRAWVEYKLENYPKNIEDIIVEVNDPRHLTKAEHLMITALCIKTNMAIYAGKTGDNPDREIPSLLGRQFDLTSLDNNMGADDGISALRVVDDDWRGDYIPYTNRPINWHTDGYYNATNRQIHALFLHCVSPADSGGENALLDHEIAYIRLREENPDYVRALMEPDAMLIPANTNKKCGVLRVARTGPVFSVSADGSLHMRYTARTRSIRWKDNPQTRSAVDVLMEYLDSNSPYIYRRTLQSGQGLISNNVLHDRSGFDDTGDSKRLLYRLRYYQRIANT